MPLERRDHARLHDMLAHAQDAVMLLGNADLAVLKADLGMRHGIVRCIEIIGEAGHHVSSATQAQLPSIPWHLMYAMRNRLIHDYGNTNYLIVHQVVSQLAPIVDVDDQSPESNTC